MFVNTDRLLILGIGVPLFFNYACFCFLVMVLASLIYGFWITIYNLAGNECDRRGKLPGADYAYCGDAWKINHTMGN
jgi:hypothetical protein